MRNSFFISKKKEQHKTKLAVGLVIFGFAGILLRYKNFESQTEPKYNFLKPKTLDPSLFFFEADFTIRNCFPRKKSPKCNIGSALLFVIYDKGERLVVKQLGTELHKTHQGIHLG